MPITVQEIVNLPIFNTAKVKSGIELLGERHVEWMSAIEGPVENFVRKYEFILTTGLGCENDADLLFEFTKDVYESGASALGIAIGRYVFEIPQEIIGFAVEKEFVLIEIPWELRFTDLQREVMKEINIRQEGFMETAREIQKTLIDYVNHGKDLTEIIRFVDEELNCFIVFTDNSGRVKTGVGDADELLAQWNRVAERAEVVEEDSAFRHIQQVDIENGYILKKEIAPGTIRVAQGSFII